MLAFGDEALFGGYSRRWITCLRSSAPIARTGLFAVSSDKSFPPEGSMTPGSYL